LKWLSLVFLCVTLSRAQPPSRLTFVSTDPSGACSVGAAIQWNATSGNLSACVGSTWEIIATGGTPGTAVWGAITGTLSSQTDLNTALGAKVTSGGALGTPTSGNASNLTNFPTLNQNTTGNAATATIASQVPTAANATATTNGQIVYDTTNNNLHGAKASADAIIAQTTASTAGNGNCVNWINSGGSLKLGDAGAACGSGGGSGGGVLTYSGPTLSILSGTAYCPVGGGGACSSTETNVDIDSSAVSTVSNMYVQISQALGAGNSVAITWRKNASSQTVTCTISGASAIACNDTTHSFAVAQSDLLDYQLVFTGTIVVTPTLLIMSQFGTVNAGVTSVTATGPITSSGGTTPNISATYQGNGTKVQASTGSTTTNDCVKFDANGNTVDAGAACSSGSAVTSVAGLTGVVPGGLVLLEQHTASSSAELDFTVCPANTSYDQYVLSMVNMTVATNGSDLEIQVSSNGGSSYDTTTNYRWGVIQSAMNGSQSVGTDGSTGGAGILFGVSSSSGGNLSTATPAFVMTGYLYGLNTAVANSFIFHGQGIQVYSGNSLPYEMWTTGIYKGAGAVNAFRLIPNSGNFSGIARCYGIAKQ
jgi:hypothetical protein